MVIKAIQMRVNTIEVPVKFYKDRNGRQSHHKREGWLSPFKAAWINLRAMFVYGVAAFLLRPGQILMGIGLVLLLMPTFGPVTFGPLVFSLYWQLLGAFAFMLGTNAFFLGLNVRTFFDYTNIHDDSNRKLFSFNRSALSSMLFFFSGLAAIFPLIDGYLSEGFELPSGPRWQEHWAVIGLSLISFAGTLFIHTLVNQALKLSSMARRK
jgi:hypothetical protein